MVSLCSRILNELDHPACAVSVAFVGPRKMRLLNRDYRGLDYPTDVLSFGYGSEIEDGMPFLGEIVVCPEVAARNAGRWQTSVCQELQKLLAHGMLHLMGYDHETDSGEMKQLQRRLLRRRFLAGSAQVLE